MSIPYSFIKVMSKEEPYIDCNGRVPKKQAEFLLEPGNMKEGYLGAYLDSCRWGSTMTVLYEMSINGMINFIQNWMEQNKDNFQNLFHERKIEELYRRFELPHIDHKVCPTSENHKGTVRDSINRVRCANKMFEELKPSYVTYFDSFDKNSGMIKRHYFESTPTHCIPDDAWDSEGKLNPIYTEEFERHNKELGKFEKEKPTFVVTDICYSIISDKKMVLPLETILRRLNLERESEIVHCDYMKPCNRLDELDESSREFYKSNESCPGHEEINEKIEFSFDGWDLAFYVQKWWEQEPKGKAPLLKK